MKLLTTFLAIVALYSCSHSQPVSYTGSTPAHADVRRFLGISMTDSIDFIRWILVLNGNRYDLECHYGISKPNTNGFIDDQLVMIKSTLIKQDPFIQLQNNKQAIYLLVVNSNLLHFANADKQLLTGDGGWSYALNNLHPTASTQFTFPYPATTPPRQMAFQGRTPCVPHADMLRVGNGSECYKMKWYMILYTDSLTGQPTYYVKGGRQYRKETMNRGQWAIKKGKQGETIYVLDPEKGDAATHLLKASDNILFITDAKGNLLVGNGDFSYTLNGTVDREPHQ